MRKLLIVLFVALLVVGCAGEPEVVTESVEVTRIVELEKEVEVPVEVTRIVEVEKEVEVPVEVTRIVEVEVTAVPTEPPAPVAAAGDEMVALNYTNEVESGGLVVEVGRVLIANKADVPQDFSLLGDFDNIDVVGEIILTITNTTDQTLSVYPDQGNVQVNSELIELFDYFLATFGDNLGGDIPPNATKIGGMWFGINRSQVGEITEMVYRFDGPSDDSFSRVGDDFEIVIDLNTREFQPIPDELADALN
ncbi:MAG: hypothetical protein KC419_17390 [Anaerolineales bacterium]|nr:hypothetical protein [Anaerolineales bacterium]MCA9930263.1 hypothetical protein [Anaerolineales bacterium]